MTKRRKRRIVQRRLAAADNVDGATAPTGAGSVSPSAGPTLGPPPPPSVDISTLAGRYSSTVARVQGLLLSQGYGPSGLVASNGRPDGLYGSMTSAR